MNAYLNAKLTEEVYMTFLTGFGKKGFVCKLLRALYGLCQSPREWWKEISAKLKLLGFIPCKGDHSVFVNDQGVIIIVYVDDIAVFAKESDSLAAVKTTLMNAYKMRDLGGLKTFTGV